MKQPRRRRVEYWVWNVDLLYYLLIVAAIRVRESKNASPDFVAINSAHKRGICIQISTIPKKIFCLSARDYLFYAIIIIFIVTCTQLEDVQLDKRRNFTYSPGLS